MTPDSILQKIKLLTALQNSPNKNEADNAATLINKLISKYNISEEELKFLEDKKPLYTETDLVYSTIGLVGWKQQLILAIAKHFNCQIVQEEIVPLEGLHQFSYFSYGDLEDSENVKYTFNFLSAKVLNLIEQNCKLKNSNYISSYAEGVVDSIKSNIIWNGINIQKINKPTSVKNEDVPSAETSNLTKTKEVKEKPAEASVDVNEQSKILDIDAFYQGLYDGEYVSLEELKLED